jgi:hypothetical protein
VIKRLIGSALLAGGLAVAMVSQAAAPAGALNTGAAVALITGGVTTSTGHAQFGNLTLAGLFAAAQTAPPSAAACGGTVQTTPGSININYTVESPAIPSTPIPSGVFYNIGNFAPGGSFSGGIPGVCSVAGPIGNGLLYNLTAPGGALSGPYCTAMTAAFGTSATNADAGLQCGGAAFVSAGVVALAELNVSYHVTTLGVLAADNNPGLGAPTGPGQEAIAVVVAVPGADNSAITGDGLGCTVGNLDCALVAGVAVVA